MNTIVTFDSTPFVSLTFHLPSPFSSAAAITTTIIARALAGSAAVVCPSAII